MNKKFIIILFFTIVALPAFSQNYMRDIGIRASKGVYLSYRNFLEDNAAVEVFLGYQEKSLRIVAMREFFKPALIQYTDNFRIVYGFGVHAGLSYNNSYKIFYREYKRKNYNLTPVFGLDGFFGLEYQLPEMPFICAINTMPYFEFSTSQYYRIDVLQGAFTIRYRF